MPKKQSAPLAAKVRSTLEEGGKIVVFGWDDISDHDEETKAYANTGKVVFLAASPWNILKNEKNLVIPTRFISEAAKGSLQERGIRHHPRRVSPVYIKRALAACWDLIFSKEERVLEEAGLEV